MTEGRVRDSIEFYLADLQEDLDKIMFQVNEAYANADAPIVFLENAQHMANQIAQALEEVIEEVELDW